jgi:hypothetical protein
VELQEEEEEEPRHAWTESASGSAITAETTETTTETAAATAMLILFASESRDDRAFTLPRRAIPSTTHTEAAAAEASAEAASWAAEAPEAGSWTLACLPWAPASTRTVPPTSPGSPPGGSGLIPREAAEAAEAGTPEEVGILAGVGATPASVVIPTAISGECPTAGAQGVEELGGDEVGLYSC